jgi:hypothetical protein
MHSQLLAATSCGGGLKPQAMVRLTHTPVKNQDLLAITRCFYTSIFKYDDGE